MNIKFFITNPVGYYGEKHILAPIGSLYIATVAKNKGCEVIFQDAYLEDPSFSFFKQRLKKERPDIIGVTCNVEDRLAGIKTAKIAKENLPSSIVVMGGPFPTMVHKEIIEKLSFVDIVVRHEGERPTKGIIDFLNKNKNLSDIKGITYRQEDNKVKVNPEEDLISDLNSLPMPDFSMINIYDYKSYIPPESAFKNMDEIKFASQKESNRAMANLIFGRGCPFNCVFCSADSMWHRKLRMLSPAKALEQVKYFLDKGVKDFVFQDDHLLANKKWFLEFAEGLKGFQNPEDPLRYACLARIDSIDDYTAKLISESGGRMVTLGIENLSDNVLKLMNKKITAEQIWDTLDILKKYKITVRGGILTETPGETFEDIFENIKKHNRLRKYLVQPGTMSPLRVYPGSPLEEIAKENNQLNFSWLDNYKNPRNYLIGAPAHVPVYENIPHEKMLPFLVSKSLEVKDHYLSRSFIREFLKNKKGKEGANFINKIKKPYLFIFVIIKYLTASPFNIISRFKFLWKVLTVKEKQR